MRATARRDHIREMLAEVSSFRQRHKGEPLTRGVQPRPRAVDDMTGLTQRPTAETGLTRA